MRRILVLSLVLLMLSDRPLHADQAQDAVDLKLAVTLAKEGRFGESLKIFDALLVSHPASLKLRLLRAKVAFRAGEMGLAESELTSLSKDGKLAPEAQVLLAQIRSRPAIAATGSTSPTAPDVAPTVDSASLTATAPVTIPASILPASPSPAPEL